jgi:molecular chaperone Hsp33
MKDRLLRITAAEGAVRAFFADTTDTVKTAAMIHDLSPVAAAALGRTLSATAILSKMLKNKKDTVTVQINGGGPLGRITTVADSNAHVRGYVDNPYVDLDLKSAKKLDVGNAVGRNGKLTVIKDQGLKTPYIGSVELKTGEIAEDFAYYFAVSEQTPSIIALGVLIEKDLSIKRSGGYLIQLMPGAGEDIVEYFEKLLVDIEPLTLMLDKSKDLLEISDRLLLELSYKVNEESEIKYECNCSEERMKENILALGRKELADILKDNKQIEVVCHFCLKKYMYDPKDIGIEVE